MSTPEFPPSVSSAPEPPQSRARATFLQLSPLLIALVLFWMMLWGSVTPLTILTGIIVALGVTRVFYLPRVELARRFNLWWMIVFLAKFFAELFIASFQVAFQALSPKGIPHSAIVKVDLRTHSDFLITGTSIAISLVPGSLIVEVDREHSILYVHALGVATPEEADVARAHVLRIERDLIRALGSAEDWEAVR